MAMHIALLRGINVGGHKMVAMSDLRDFLTRLGFDNVQSLLQSGNLVFESGKTPAQLEKMLETEAQKQLGLATSFVIRTADEWDAVVRRNPFPREAKSDPALLVVMFMKEPFDASRLSIPGREVVKADGCELYIFYPDGQGRSKLKIPAVGTARNWNTVLKLRNATVPVAVPPPSRRR